MVFHNTPGFMALAFLVAFPFLSTALPIESRQFEQLDFADFEARDGALSCSPVSLEQIKSLPAWKKIEQYAKDNYGEGGVNIVTNPSDYPDRQLQACMKGSKVPVQFAETPQCTTTRKNIDGRSTGTDSEIEFSTKTGISQTSSWTVTHSSTLTAGVKFGVTIGVPGIGATAETYMETTIHDERTTSFEGKNEHEETVTMKYNNKSGDKCKMELVTQMCTATAKGRAPVVASGFVWFNYEDKRAPKNSPGDGEHYKYSINIDSILSEAERTSFIEFQGPMNSRSSTTYDTNCTKDKPPAKKNAPAKPPAGKPGAPKPDPKKPAPKTPAPKAPAPKKPAPKKPAPKKPAPAKPAPKPAGKPAPKPAGKPTKKR